MYTAFRGSGKSDLDVQNVHKGKVVFYTSLLESGCAAFVLTSRLTAFRAFGDLQTSLSLDSYKATRQASVRTDCADGHRGA